MGRAEESWNLWEVHFRYRSVPGALYLTDRVDNYRTVEQRWEAFGRAEMEGNYLDGGGRSKTIVG